MADKTARASFRQPGRTVCACVCLAEAWGEGGWSLAVTPYSSNKTSDESPPPVPAPFFFAFPLSYPCSHLKSSTTLRLQGTRLAPLKEKPRARVAQARYCGAPLRSQLPSWERPEMDYCICSLAHLLIDSLHRLLPSGRALLQATSLSPHSSALVDTTWASSFQFFAYCFPGLRTL